MYTYLHTYIMRIRMWPRTCVVTDAPLRRPNAGNETRKREWEKNRDALVMDRTGICNGVGINKIDIIICEMRCNTYLVLYLWWQWCRSGSGRSWQTNPAGCAVLCCVREGVT
jgi:hypothetical protein